MRYQYDWAGLTERWEVGEEYQPEIDDSPGNEPHGVMIRRTAPDGTQTYQALPFSVHGPIDGDAYYPSEAAAMAAAKIAAEKLRLERGHNEQMQTPPIRH